MPLSPLNGTASVALADTRSEDVQEILGHIPGWTLRWGITFIFVILAFVLLGSWLVRYPDTITAQIVLTTHTPPAPIVARAGGRLHLSKQDKQLVEEGEILGYLENPARQEDIMQLKQQLANYKQQLDRSDNFSTAMQLGELQSAYLRFVSTLRDERLMRQQAAYAQRITALRGRVQQYQQLSQSLEQQAAILFEELTLAQKQYDRDQMLYQQQTIAATDWEQRQIAFLKIQQSYEAVQANKLTNAIQITQLQAQILEQQLARDQQQAEAQAAISDAQRQLESELAAWEQQYLLKAPLSGRVTLTNYWSNAHFVQPGEEIMTVVPQADALYGQVRMPIAGSGKVETGQTVRIKFDNYPYAEYGTVRGEVASISAVPHQQLYTIAVRLPEGLTTSYRKELPFRQEMQGTADIVTRDLRLLERIFYQLRQLIDQAA